MARFWLSFILSAALIFPPQSGKSESTPPANPLPASPLAAILDPAFGGFGPNSFRDISGMTVNRIIQAEDGSLYALGFTEINPNRYVQVQRFLPDGIQDASFNFTAVIQGEARAAAVDTNGRMYVVGDAGSNFFVLCLNTLDGSKDTAFGLTGIVYTDFDGGFDSAQAVVIQPGHHIVAAGYAAIGGDDDFALARYNQNGALDTAFGGDGKVTTGFGSGPDAAYALALLPGGGMLAAGYKLDSYFSGVDYDFAIARYLDNGSLDTSFDGDGKLALGFSHDDAAYDLQLTPDGSQFVVAGCANCYVYTSPDFNSSLAVARYNLNGTPDTSFDADGKVTYNPSSFFDRVITAIPYASGGVRLIAALDMANEGPSQAAAFVDFSAAGAWLNTYLDTTIARPIASFQQPDGKTILAGRSRLARYLPTGSDQPGSSAADLFAGDDQAYAILPDAGGYWVAGETQTATIFGAQVALVRYNTAGQLDPVHGSPVALAGGAGDDHVRSAVLDQFGRVIVAGFLGDTDSNFAVYRFLPDGAPDTAFHALGYTFTDFGLGNDYAQAVLLQPQLDGSKKIIAAGFAFDGVTYDAALARYNENGSLDTTFGAQGKIRQDLGAGFARIRAAVVQADRKIVVVGGHAGDFVAIRFMPDGGRDPSFGGDGIVEQTMGGNDEAHAVALYPNNQLLVAGYTDGNFGWVMLSQAAGALCLCGSVTGFYKADLGGVDTPHALLVQPDGRFILAGGGSAGASLSLARWRKVPFTGVGYELDPTFAPGGMMTIGIETGGEIRALAFDSLYRLVAAGITHNDYNDDFALARLAGVTNPPQPVQKFVYIPLISR